MELSTTAVKKEVSISPIRLGPWQEPIVLSGEELDTTSLSLCSLGNDIFLFGKAANESLTYWSRSSGSTFSNIELLAFAGAVQPFTQGPMTAATSQDQLTLIWSGAEGDQTMWMNTYNSSPAGWIGDQVNLPAGDLVCPGTGPALSFLNGEAYLLWAGSGMNGYFYAKSLMPTSNNWTIAGLMDGTGAQSTFATPRLVLSSGTLLSLWGAPSGNQVVYGTITPTSASAIGLISAPTDPIYAAASVQTLVGAAAILLWNTGQYQIHALGEWLPLQAASNNFQLPSDVQGFSAYCLGNTLYVAWASGPTVTIQTASLTV